MSNPNQAANLRILMVQPTGLSGIWHYANALSAALRAQDLDVRLATQEPFEDLGPLLGVPVVTFGKRAVSQNGWRQSPPLTSRALHHLSKLTRLSRVIRGFRPHIVHFHAALGALDFVYYRVFQRMGLRVVLTAHDGRSLSGNDRWTDWARYRSADHVWVHSEQDFAYLRARGLGGAQVSKIAHGNYLRLCENPTLDKYEARQRLGIAPDIRLLLFFGAISLYKGVGVLLQAFAQVSSVDARARLMIVGEPLHPFDEFASQIENLGVRDRVIVRLEYVPFHQLPELFRAADAVVLPYLRISQSGVMQLAYGFGRAVVASAVGGLGETVREDATGVVVEPNDPGALARGISRIFESPEATDAMGRRARTLAETKYSWDRVATATAEVYRRLLFAGMVRPRVLSSAVPSRGAEHSHRSSARHPRPDRGWRP